MFGNIAQTRQLEVLGNFRDFLISSLRFLLSELKKTDFLY